MAKSEVGVGHMLANLLEERRELIPLAVSKRERLQEDGGMDEEVPAEGEGELDGLNGLDGLDGLGLLRFGRRLGSLIA
jgi:hypothetical protein